MSRAALRIARPIMAMFFDNEITIGHGVTMLKIMALGLPFFGAYLMVGEIHMGVGLNTPAMVMDIIHAWVLQVGPILILTNLMGFDQTAIWWTIAAAGTVSSVAFYFYYQRGRWLTVKV